MTGPSPNRSALIATARALGPLRKEMVFLGGQVAELLITDPASVRIRPTDDVDAIVAVATRTAYFRLHCPTLDSIPASFALFTSGLPRSQLCAAEEAWDWRPSVCLRRPGERLSPPTRPGVRPDYLLLSCPTFSHPGSGLSTTATTR